MSVSVLSHLVFVTTFGDELFTFCDKVMLALLDQEQCNDQFFDSAVSADADQGVMEIEAMGKGADVAEAIATVQAAIRAAFHSLGVGTPSWPTHDETLSVVLKTMQNEEIQPAVCSATAGT